MGVDAGFGAAAASLDALGPIGIIAGTSLMLLPMDKWVADQIVKDVKTGRTIKLASQNLTGMMENMMGVMNGVYQVSHPAVTTTSWVSSVDFGLSSWDRQTIDVDTEGHLGIRSNLYSSYLRAPMVNSLLAPLAASAPLMSSDVLPSAQMSLQTPMTTSPTMGSARNVVSNQNCCIPSFNMSNPNPAAQSCATQMMFTNALKDTWKVWMIPLLVTTIFNTRIDIVPARNYWTHADRVKYGGDLLDD